MSEEGLHGCRLVAPGLGTQAAAKKVGHIGSMTSQGLQQFIELLLIFRSCAKTTTLPGLPSTALQSGYLKLLDFHRERAREKRRMGIG